MLKPVRCLPFVFAWLLVGLPWPAAGQIYTWHEANGNLVASDHPPEGTARSYKVIGTSFRSTRPAVSRYATSYDRIIEKHAATYSVSPQLVRAVVQVESGFNRWAVSPKGAMGLMQLMPATAIEMGVRDPFDPDDNVRGGVAYLRQLLNRYGDVQLALAAYNAGPEAVARHNYQVPPFRETRNYVSQVGRRATVGGSAPAAATPRPAGRAAGKTAAATATSTPPGRVYRYWERTADGRMIQKYSDTKPASGDYDIVR